ncbi:hypothetical protein L1987_81238 [Smallanthus sonchifolius]|uniref:Uncharacterized protein n=1 Tax=Smallanthus sonchifolius TaxID=185202 RepID=A0ACB8YQN1_9ASTR|nr:hypothetical protein L1987_81238 [Smallanthus sonchifolius]
MALALNVVPSPDGPILNPDADDVDPGSVLVPGTSQLSDDSSDESGEVPLYQNKRPAVESSSAHPAKRPNIPSVFSSPSPATTATSVPHSSRSRVRVEMHHRMLYLDDKFHGILHQYEKLQKDLEKALSEKLGLWQELGKAEGKAQEMEDKAKESEATL